MSEYLKDKPSRLVIKDKDYNIKNIQEFKHNEKGDIIYYAKTENNNIVIELVYEYSYDEKERKKCTKIIDKITSNITIMEYSY